MLTQRLNVSLQLGSLSIQPSSFNFQVSSTRPDQSTRLTITPLEFEVTRSPQSQVQVDMRPVQDDLGFLRPIQFRQKYEGVSDQKAAAAVARYVSLGNNAIRNPQGAAAQMGASAGGFSADTQIGVSPGVRPSIAVSEATKVGGELTPGRVDVQSNPVFEIIPNFQRARITLSQAPRVNISIGPYEVAGRNFDAVV